MGIERRVFAGASPIAVFALLITGVASAQDSTLVVYDYDQIGNLVAVRRTDMKSDPQHCGAPTNVCAAGANGRAVCEAAACTLKCDSGYLLAANRACGSITSAGVKRRYVPFDGFMIPIFSIAPGSIFCDGAFISGDNDPNNCGACGRVCPGAVNGRAVCSAGTCTIACDPGHLLAANGVCGSASSAGVIVRRVPFDLFPIPVRAAPAGSFYCGGKFVLPGSDPDNCGQCGNVCPAGAGGTRVCNAGTCG